MESFASALTLDNPELTNAAPADNEAVAESQLEDELNAQEEQIDAHAEDDAAPHYRSSLDQPLSAEEKEFIRGGNEASPSRDLDENHMPLQHDEALQPSTRAEAPEELPTIYWSADLNHMLASFSLETYFMLQLSNERRLTRRAFALAQSTFEAANAVSAVVNHATGVASQGTAKYLLSYS
jgi:hypothetical protein